MKRTSEGCLSPDIGPLLPSPLGRFMRLVAIKFEDVDVLPERLLATAPAMLRDWDTDEEHGQCVEACDEFLHLLAGYGIEASIRTWNCPFFSEFLGRDKVAEDMTLLPDETFPWSWDGMDFHAVVEVEDFLIDWTAKQFDPNAPFPMVWKKEN
jgi:hypothetical protein